MELLSLNKARDNPITVCRQKSLLKVDKKLKHFCSELAFSSGVHKRVKRFLGHCQLNSLVAGNLDHLFNKINIISSTERPSLPSPLPPKICFQ